MQLADLFDASLEGQRDAPGIEYEAPDGRLAALTFGEIAARSHRLARLLQQRGLAAGDRLAIHLSNRVELIDVVLACIRPGVVFVPINILYREREIEVQKHLLPLVAQEDRRSQGRHEIRRLGDHETNTQ